MSKRKLSARDKSLTGGSGDVKPQQLVGALTQLSVDTHAVLTIPLPVSKLVGTKQSATIIEILKVLFYYATPADSVYELWAWLATTQLVATGAVGQTLSATVLNRFGDAHIIACFAIEQKITTSGGITERMPIEVDLTDGAGNGVLVATDSLTFECNTDNVGVVSPFAFRALYRTYDAGILEYVGIIQSQQ